MQRRGQRICISRGLGEKALSPLGSRWAANRDRPLIPFHREAGGGPEKPLAHSGPRPRVAVSIVLLGIIMTSLSSPLNTCTSLGPPDSLVGERATPIFRWVGARLAEAHGFPADPPTEREVWAPDPAPQFPPAI